MRLEGLTVHGEASAFHAATELSSFAFARFTYDPSLTWDQFVREEIAPRLGGEGQQIGSSRSPALLDSEDPIEQSELRRLHTEAIDASRKRITTPAVAGSPRRPDRAAGDERPPEQHLDHRQRVLGAIGRRDAGPGVDPLHGLAKQRRHRQDGEFGDALSSGTAMLLVTTTSLIAHSCSRCTAGPESTGWIADA